MCRNVIIKIVIGVRGYVVNSKLFNSLLILLFIICSSCQSIKYSYIQETHNYSNGNSDLIIASLDDYNIYYDVIEGEVIDKEERKKSEKKWLLAALTIILVVVTVSVIAIINDDNGGDSNKTNGNGMNTDDVIDMDVVF